MGVFEFIIGFFVLDFEVYKFVKYERVYVGKFWVFCCVFGMFILVDYIYIFRVVEVLDNVWEVNIVFVI